MKIILKRNATVLFAMLISSASFAQWSINGSIIQNTNSGDVVIGSTSHLRTYGRVVSYYPKSNTPLGGEYLGTSGWWGLRTDTDNSFHLDIYNNNSPKSVFSVNQQGQAFFNARKSDTPLNGEIFGSSGWWGFRTDTENTFHLDMYHSNAPESSIGVKQNGNVLIGASWDDGKLSISRVDPGNVISMNASGANAYLKIGLASEYAWIQSYGPRPLRINDLGNDVIFNTNGGNVGIGTVSTDAKLTVKGDIHTREVRVDISGGTGPDYVFEKDYNLLPLSELETYITQNKHLPEVPSAKEMEADGLNLKEMNLILLKKVEELTLHLISLEKQTQFQQKQNEEQQKLIDQIIPKAK